MEFGSEGIVGIIHKLPDHVVNQIKAGEVVDRPSSVVKELVENAIDAGGTTVHVELLDGGKQLIRISDDGRGMDKEDLLACLERHATSKLHRVEELTTISSLGFRGEAIPSIAAVSRFSIRSRTAEIAHGHEVEVFDGSTEAVREVAMNRGTVVSVRDLFANVPARQKFMKATATEFAHINDFLFALSLAYPHVSLRLTHNGRDVFEVKKHTKLQERLLDMLGAEAREFAALDFSRGRFRVRGFVGLPEAARPAPKYFVTFVNGRLVRDRIIRAGVLQGYSGLLMKGLLPSAVLFIEVDPSWVDVNVHPAKTELRFLDAVAVQDLISIGVQNAVKDAAMSRSVPTPSEPSVSRSSWEPSSASLSSSQRSSTTPSVPSSLRSGSPFSSSFPTSASVRVTSANRVEEFLGGPPPSAPPMTQQSEQPSPALFENLSGPFTGAAFLGQYRNCYLLLECAGELWVVDQHAFHERILFEELLRDARKQGRTPSQELLSPMMVSLPLGTVEIVRDSEEALLKVGFRVEVMDSNQVAVHAFPAMLAPDRVGRLFDELLARIFAMAGLSASDAHPLLLQAQDMRRDSLGDEATIARLDGDSVHHLFYATMACHSAVRAGEPLNAELVRRLLARAGDVDFFANCPHGRPVVRKFSEADVSAWFARI